MCGCVTGWQAVGAKGGMETESPAGERCLLSGGLLDQAQYWHHSKQEALHCSACWGTALLIMLCSADRSSQLVHAWGCSVACRVVPHQQVSQLVHAELQQAGKSEWEYALIVWCYARQLLQL